MKIIFPTDEHHPFCDWNALAVAYQIAEDYKPEVRFAGSDGVDFYSISRFDKDPALFKENIQKELDSWALSQRLWQKVTPTATVYFLVGNHEDRLRRYLWKNPELYSLRALKMENLFRFRELGIIIADNEGLEQNFYNQLIVKHGTVVRQYSGYSARAEMERERYQISTLSGHTHRGGHVLTTTRSGVKQAVEGFCLCDTNPNYLHNPDWQNGIVLADVDKEGVEFELIPFQKDTEGRVSARWREHKYES